MGKYRTPDEWEERIIQENGLNPKQFAVQHRTEDAIFLLNYKTRDTVTIYRGDRKW